MDALGPGVVDGPAKVLPGRRSKDVKDVNEGNKFSGIGRK